MAVVSMKQLLEAGVHFGHPTKHWDPKMKPYIYTARNGIYILDLKITAQKMEEAYEALLKIVKGGGKVLFAGTKKQAQEIIREVAEETGHFYVDQRWVGGTLTNFNQIKNTVRRLNQLYEMEEKGEFEKYTKLEVLKFKRERDKLARSFWGIREMKKLPDALFIVDPRKENNAILEAKKLNIPVFGIVDTNCNPELIDYVIPANDDAIKSVNLIVSVMGNAIIEAQGGETIRFDDEELDEAELINISEADIKTKEYQERQEKKKSTKKTVKAKKDSKETPRLKEKPTKTVSKKQVKEDKVEAKKEEKLVTKSTKKTEEPKATNKVEKKEAKKTTKTVKSEKPKPTKKVEKEETKPSKKVEEKETKSTKKETKPTVKSDKKQTSETAKTKSKKVVVKVTEKKLVPKNESPDLLKELQIRTVSELREYAKANKIVGYSQLKKADLINLIYNSLK